ncbi:glycerol-3-phosphate dehydrogenase/oxidase [Aquibacillus sediminis]|uniref:glycerol-3-phosphate dehydrogenase/oxidase n=1 Tax=Aquibacillus sediminis TaxID=2574734 RepID=UPI00110863BF|nr:glycerol-3-phosphate dehydrogenase/oxidase [Aquibacillus sediminis]
MTKFSNLNRAQTYQRLTEQELDIFVIGGGITGAGIALDAVTRGLKTGLVEMQDFAAGTSSRSTKLIHGGLRYLEQKEFAMVSEVGKERAIVYENGPHVTKPEWMLLPFYKDGNLGPLKTNAGLRLYDFLAKVKKDERRTMLSDKQALEKEPLLKKENLKGAGFYVEYKTDDARLTIEVMKQAVKNGAMVNNYAKVVDFIYDRAKKIKGVVIEDQITGQQFQVMAKKIINATGPWVDHIRDLDGSKQGKTLHLTKGVHLVFDQSVFPLRQAVYFDHVDGRMIFAIPRGEKNYVGTTDTTYQSEIAHPVVTHEDCDYIIDAIKQMFPTVQVTLDDVESSWAGIRPLIAEEGKDPSEVSRKDEIMEADSGLLSIAGGKLTGYRKMAEQVIDQVVKQFKRDYHILYSESVTKDLPISGGDVGGSKGFETFKQEQMELANQLGIEEETALRCVDRYGSNVQVVWDYYETLHNQALEAGIDRLVFAELRYAIDYECVYQPVDFFIRRTSALFFDIEWVKRYKDAVANYMDQVFKWSKEQKKFYLRELEEVIDEAVHPVE